MFLSTFTAVAPPPHRGVKRCMLFLSTPFMRYYDIGTDLFKGCARFGC